MVRFNRRSTLAATAALAVALCSSAGPAAAKSGNWSQQRCDKAITKYNKAHPHAGTKQRTKYLKQLAKHGCHFEGGV